MNRTRATIFLSMMFGASVFGHLCEGAAPVAPSHQGVLDQIAHARKEIAGPSATMSAWTAVFDSIERNVKAYGAAKTEADRLAVLEQLWRQSESLRSTGWPPAGKIRAALDTWLQPRLTLSQAIRSLDVQIQRLPQTHEPGRKSNRERWEKFDDDLGNAIQAYENATTVAQRAEARDRIHKALETLWKINHGTHWEPSLQLSQALANLFERPNLEASADYSVVAPLFIHNVVTSGPIYRRGQVSYVTAGPHSGFGLLSSDNGVAFYNSQWLTSYTPIRGFNEQVASDPQGQRAAKMYYFTAASQDQSNMQVTTWIRPSGMQLAMGPTRNIQLMVQSCPLAGAGFQRLIAGLIGMDQGSINEQVRDGAYGRVSQEVMLGSQEEANDRAARERAEFNSRLASFLLFNQDVAKVGPIDVIGLDLRSRPEFAFMRGTVEWRRATDQHGSDAPKPPQFARIAPGITVDVHLPSLLANLARGGLEAPDLKPIENLMVISRPPAPGSNGKRNVQTVRNADYAQFLAAAQEVQSGEGSRGMVLRVRRPSQPPEFGVDSQGRLVAMVRDLVVDVPPPGQRALVGGPGVKAYRLVAKQAEFALSLRFQPAAGANQAHVLGKIESFDPGPGAQLFDLGEDETKAQPMNPLTTAVALGVVRALAQGQDIDVPLDPTKVPDIRIRSIAPIDTSGWTRVVMQTTKPLSLDNLNRPRTAAPAPAPTVSRSAPAPAPTTTRTAPVPSATLPVGSSQPAPAPVPVTVPARVGSLTPIPSRR